MKDKIYINTKHIIDNNKKFKLEYIKVNDESNNPVEIDIGIENPIFKKELLIIIVFFITYNLNYLLFIFPQIESFIISKYLFLLLYGVFFPYYLINREIRETKSDIINYIEKIFKSIEKDNIENYDKLYYSFKFKINIKKITNIRIFIYLLEL